MKKLITGILSIGMIFLFCSDKVYAGKRNRGGNLPKTATPPTARPVQQPVQQHSLDDLFAQLPPVSVNVAPPFTQLSLRHEVQASNDIKPFEGPVFEDLNGDLVNLKLEDPKFQNTGKLEEPISLSDEFFDSQATQPSSNQLIKQFSVSFNNADELIYFTRCNQYKFCDFIGSLYARMNEPAIVSMVRDYGFGLGHVPLLLIWSGHLFNRLMSSSRYIFTTQDLKDVLMLMLVVDLRAQVDATCLVNTKKKSTSWSVPQVDSSVVELAKQIAPNTAEYLKGKLAALWRAKILEMYNQKKLPSYAKILDSVASIAIQWNEEQLQSPIWVSCVKKASLMGFNNLLAGWDGDKFGNWWNADPALVTAYEGCNYVGIRSDAITNVLTKLKKHTSWEEYFGPLISFKKIENAEYDSDGGF